MFKGVKDIEKNRRHIYNAEEVKQSKKERRRGRREEAEADQAARECGQEQ
tara:strand:+ start:872 stop:1021 length:150 start_codon:yes stop_codon:yes gene_type:complete